MADLIGKRFLSFFVSLGAGFVGCKYLDGAQAATFLTFVATISGLYMTNQSSTDIVKVIKGVITK